jgi:lipoate-protein ligase A
MEVHPKAARATMAQAMAHNTKTVDSDVDMLVKVLNARKDYEGVRTVLDAQKHLKNAYAAFLELFGEYVAEVTPDEFSDHHQHDGSERNFIDVINAATKEARKDETR